MRHNAVTVPHAVPTLSPPTLASESVTPLARISSIASACLIWSSCSVASSLAMSCGRGEDRYGGVPCSITTWTDASY